MFPRPSETLFEKKKGITYKWHSRNWTLVSCNCNPLWINLCLLREQMNSHIMQSINDALRHQMNKQGKTFKIDQIFFTNKMEELSKFSLDKTESGHGHQRWTKYKEGITSLCSFHGSICLSFGDIIPKEDNL